MEESFCSGCGRSSSECPGCSRPLDPPRFCRLCGKRMYVQVTPTGYVAMCPVRAHRSHGFPTTMAPEEPQA